MKALILSKEHLQILSEASSELYNVVQKEKSYNAKRVSQYIDDNIFVYSYYEELQSLLPLLQQIAEHMYYIEELSPLYEIKLKQLYFTMVQLIAYLKTSNDNTLEETLKFFTKEFNKFFD